MNDFYVTFHVRILNLYDGSHSNQWSVGYLEPIF
jgi:hypothetical protein